VFVCALKFVSLNLWRFQINFFLYNISTQAKLTTDKILTITRSCSDDDDDAGAHTLRRIELEFFRLVSIIEYYIIIVVNFLFVLRRNRTRHKLFIDNITTFVFSYKISFSFCAQKLFYMRKKILDASILYEHLFCIERKKTRRKKK
jgi:hypothetical protein